MSAEAVMTNAAALWFVGTNVQTVVIESALDLVNGAWPGCIVSCPRTAETRAATGRIRPVHTIHVQYLDRWDLNTKSVQTMAAAARSALEAIKANIRSNLRMVVSGATTVEIAGDSIDTEVEGIVREVQGQQLPFPLFVGSLVVEVRDQWITA